jgi:uncharacterized membrane protein YhhN
MKKNIYYLLILVSAIFAVYFAMTGHHSYHAIFKPLTTILIIIFPVLFRNAALGKYTNLIIWALVFCLFGDIFLLNDDYFVFGLSSFLVAHLLFAFSFIKLFGLQKNYPVLGILLLITSLYLFYLKSGLGSLLFPVSVYMIIIVFMTWQAVSCHLKHRELITMIITLAAVLFLFSDAMIALNKFKMPFELSRLVILSTYWTSIFLFAYSTQLNPNKLKLGND